MQERETNNSKFQVKMLLNKITKTTNSSNQETTEISQVIHQCDVIHRILTSGQNHNLQRFFYRNAF